MPDETRATEEQDSTFPMPSTFLLREPLYESHALSDDWAEELNSLRWLIGTVDTDCPFCRGASIFRRVRSNTNRYVSGGDPPDWHKFAVTLECQRNTNHTLYFLFLVAGGTVRKIGQFPSLADLHAQDATRYRDLLGEKYPEFTRAIGLAAHGIGIGSFVYLRRIFEGLIGNAHKVAADADDWDEEEYRRSRMDERIGLLREHLPDFLVENRVIYGILSKGIHELTDAECLEHFDPIRVGIELILDEELDRKRRQSKVDQARAVIANVHRNLSE